MTNVQSLTCSWLIALTMLGIISVWSHHAFPPEKTNQSIENHRKQDNLPEPHAIFSPSDAAMPQLITAL